MDQKGNAWIANPLGTDARLLVLNGVPLGLVADLPEGGFLQIVPGQNPLGIPVPSVPAAAGTMVAVIPAEVAAEFRSSLQKVVDDQAKKMLTNPGGGVLPLMKPGSD